MELSVGELACTYAALILHDDGIPVTAEKIGILLKASNLSVESYWPSLFAKLCAKKNVDELILNAGSGSGGGGAGVTPAAVAASAPEAAAAASKVEEEPKGKPAKDESSDDEDIGDLFNMFD